MSDPTVDPTAAAHFDTILRATATCDYPLFSSVLSENMKELVPASQFAGTCQRLSPLLNAAYQSQYMGALRSASSLVYFWRLTFEGQPTDKLVRLGIRAGQVVGVLFTPPFETGLRSKPAT